ncbi:MAG: ABC transporter ATP-binding protein [Clostridia bacterium]|nr:ABC transporter ATP-binding protein [Clostridia bacterium]
MKKWEIPLELDRLPPDILSIAEEKGIRYEDILITFYTDKNADFGVADTYILVTGQRLLSVCGTRALEKRVGRHSYTTEHLRGVFHIDSIEEYALDQLKSFRLTEHLSGASLIVEGEEGPRLLAVMSGFCKQSAQVFVRYANRLLKEGRVTVDEEDLPKNHACPTCGMRYPDKNRHICPHCMKRGSLFGRMLKFFFKYKGYLIVTLLSLLAMTLLGTLTPYLSSGFFFDEVLDEGGSFYGRVAFLLFLIVGTRLITAFFTMVNNYVTSVIAARVVYDLKKVIFGSIGRLSLGFFTARQTGGLMTQVNRDSNTIYEFFCDGVPYFIVNIVQTVVLAVLLFVINPLLALCSLCTVPLFLFVMKWLYKNQSRLHARCYSGSSRLNSFLADVLSGIRVVKAFSREQDEIGRFDERNRRVAESDRNLAVYNNYVFPLSSLILYAGNIIAWAVGGFMVMKGIGGMTYGSLLTFIAYINMIYTPMNFFVTMVNRTADCSNAMQRLFEIMDARPEVSEKENPVRIEKFRGDVTFREVDFSYNKSRKVIDSVSFSVKAGERLGIVGHTGAGKSTLANLLIRLYDTDSGDILIDGYSVRDLAFEDLYRNIAIVSQETYLFVGTVLDNIRYACPDATPQEVISAAKLAGCHDFIMKMPDGYETRIGFGYKDLSGGERQRISIARAILRDPKILILDEATAAMDTETERRIQEAIERLTVGKTTIMIAHRLSTLREADFLVVIEGGRIAERGTQSELLQKEDGVYRKLYTLQQEALKNAGIAE